jgi:tetratricopeptide (TPR) repeat protein
MAKTIKASESGLQRVDQARRMKKWNKVEKAWFQLATTSEATLKRFWARKTPINADVFENICKVVGIDDWEAISELPTFMPATTPSHFSAYNPQTFTGRDDEIAQFTTLLSGSCRILAITGMTGIGKTALAERVVANLMEIPKSSTLPYIRFSLDDRSLSPDFSITGSALLRTLGEEPTLADQQDAANLLAHILKRLCSNPCRLQIDSLERLLKGNEQEGWSEFCDPLWLDLLHQFVAGNDCPSQLLLTSQDITGDLDAVASRYSEFYQCQTLRGLKSDEQQKFFQKLGLLADPDSAVTDLDYLNRIGAFHDGHPLVLQVIADEILQPLFQGNIARYWHHYEAEFSETADSTTNKLARSRLFRRRVRQRVEQTIQRLPSPARQMLCACAVFRRPVPIGFWLAMLTDEEPQAEFDTLQDRHLVEFVSASDDKLLVRQHNLIRSVAYDLLKADAVIWEQAERQAAELWLTAYKPAPDALNLETVRGELEAFEHFCQLGDWGAAKTILLDQQIGQKLQNWGNYQKMLTFHRRLLGHLQLLDEVACQRGLGNAYIFLSNYPQAILCYQQSLSLACKIGDEQGQRKALNNLGNLFQRLGQYVESINYLQQTLTLAREIGDRQGEGNALGNLGLVYDQLGQYKKAIECHLQDLMIAREIGHRQDEGIAQGGLGSAYHSIGQYEKAIECYIQYLTIAREIGDRQGEGNAQGGLGNAYHSIGQYKKAIECHLQSLTIAREIGHRQGEGNAQCGLGNVHHTLGQYGRAIEYHLQHLTITHEIGDRQGEEVALGNLGNACHRLGQYEKAIEYHLQSLTIAHEIGYREGEGNALGYLGNVYHSLVQHEKAIEYHLQSLTIAREIGDLHGEGAALVNLGRTQFKLGQYSESLTYSQLALEVFRETNVKAGESEVLKNLAELHQAQGELEKARQYCQQALALAIELGIPLVAECQTLMESLDREAEEAKVVQEEIS